MKPFYWALGAAVVWGIAPIFEKIGLAKIPPIPGLLFRGMGVIIGTSILIAVKWDVIKPYVWPWPEGFIFLSLGGIMASVLGQICFYHALKKGDASLVVPVGASYPLIAFILGIIFLGEKITVSKLGGMALIILGVLLLK